jgi:hypothetical protein
MDWVHPAIDRTDRIFCFPFHPTVLKKVTGEKLLPMVLLKGWVELQ